jgi:hypothetical protein
LPRSLEEDTKVVRGACVATSSGTSVGRLSLVQVATFVKHDAEVVCPVRLAALIRAAVRGFGTFQVAAVGEQKTEVGVLAA